MAPGMNIIRFFMTFIHRRILEYSIWNHKTLKNSSPPCLSKLELAELCDLITNRQLLFSILNDLGQPKENARSLSISDMWYAFGSLCCAVHTFGMVLVPW